MKIYDISVPIRPGMHTYPGDAQVEVQRTLEIGADSHHALSRLVLGSHTGTHIDPPAHFYINGLTADKIPLDVLVGPATVVEMSEGKAVTKDFLEGLRLPTLPGDASGTRPSAESTTGQAGLPERTERILFKTTNGALWDMPAFQRRFVYIEEGAARWLVERGVRLVGIDYLSAEQYGARQPTTHWALLGAGVIILEGIDLRDVPPGDYLLACLPLKVEGGDGAPARAVLITE